MAGFKAVQQQDDRGRTKYLVVLDNGSFRALMKSENDAIGYAKFLSDHKENQLGGEKAAEAFKKMVYEHDRMVKERTAKAALTKEEAIEIFNRMLKQVLENTSSDDSSPTEPEALPNHHPDQSDKSPPAAPADGPAGA